MADRAETITRSASPVVRRARLGLGLFARRSYREGSAVVKITGLIRSADDIWDIGGATMNNAFRFGPETYLDPLDGFGRYLNHSCRPNAAVTKRNHQLFLLAAESITVGDEITIDYSTILGDDDIWTMRCRCDTPQCRRIIRRFGSLPESLRQNYLRRGMVPKHIIATFSR